MSINLRVDPRKAYRFADFGLHPSVLKSVDKTFATPLPMQRKMMALNFSGYSVYAESRPNSGKSTAATLCLLSTPSKPAPFITNLVLVPTPALADQYFAAMNQFGTISHVKKLYRTSSEEVDEEQHKQLIQDPVTHTLIATPHRILDYLSSQPHLLPLHQLKQLVIDELDIFSPLSATMKQTASPLELLVDYIYECCSGSPPTATLMSSFKYSKFSKLPNIVQNSGRQIYEAREPAGEWKGVCHNLTSINLGNEVSCAQEVKAIWAGPGLVIVPQNLSPLKMQTHLAQQKLDAAVAVRPSEVAGLHIENIENIYCLGQHVDEDIERLKWMMPGPTRNMYIVQ